MLTVLSPGLRATLQDAGRLTSAHLGVPRAGAADRGRYEAANWLVGNPDGEAVIEALGAGLVVQAQADLTVALTGDSTRAEVSGRSVPTGQAIYLAAGQVLTVTHTAGMYTYLAVAGGIDPDGAVLGSASTCALSGLGPAPLAAGAQIRPRRLPVSVTPVWGRAVRDLAPASSGLVLVPVHGFGNTPGLLAALMQNRWEVSGDVSRVGVRLAGARLDTEAGSGTLPSMGMVRGLVQLPPNGQPIVLGPDHGTTGGYPVLGVLTRASTDQLMQLTPGTRLRFTLDETTEARTTRLDLAALA